MKSGIRSVWLGMSVLLAGLVATLVVYRLTAHAERVQVTDAAQARASEVANYLGQRFHEYEQALRSGAALFEAKPELSRADWNHFVTRLEIDQNYPGTQGIGYAAWLTPGEVGPFEASVRAEGFADFSVTPSGVRNAYTSIQFLEPFDARNQRAFGYDMYSQPTRREAMDRARDTGEAALSGKVLLVQETDVDRQNGVLLYLPVYQGVGVPATVEARRAQLRGFVYSPLRMDDLIRGVLKDSFRDIVLRIYDEVDDDPQAMLYRSPALSHQELHPEGAQQKIVLPFAGRNWVLQVMSAPWVVAPASRSTLVLIGGSLVTVLLALLIWGLASGRERARLLAERLTIAYRDTQRTQKAILDSVADGVLTVDADGRVLSANPAAERIFAASADRLRNTSIDDLIPSHARVVEALGDSSETTRSELQACAFNGRKFPVELSVNPLSGVQAQSILVESVRDISERRRAEELLARSSGLREAILNGAPFAIVATDERGVISELNPAAATLLGYERRELVGRAALPIFVELPMDPTEFQMDGRVRKDPANDMDTLFDRARQGEVDEREVTYVRKDGSRVLVNQVLTAMRDNALNVVGYLAVAYDITERKRAEDYIRHLAHHDALTALPNRALFKDRLDAAIVQARQSGRQVGVLMVDLDHFKRINDSLGHVVGDELLVHLTARVQSCVGEGDTVARMGGDEFVIVLPELADTHDAIRVARTLVEVISKPVQTGSHELHVTPSVGVCFYPEDGKDSMTLLKNADTAMYHAKESGRNGFSVFSLDMLRVSEEKMQLENSLRRALAENRLQMYFQPLVAASTGRVEGMEALLRWPKEDGSFVPPDVFIPIAEDTGLIAQIGETLMVSACRQALEIGEELGRPISLAVNVSPQQFHHQNLADLIRSVLDKTGLPASQLTLEITERILVRDPDEASETLRSLRELGVGVAIDDFGTGYSSLAYISQFPISKLKIDRSFVRDLGEDTADTAVINAVIAMGHSLGLTVIAEGVETRLQYDYLRSRGCDEAQGFLFSPGVPATEFATMVRRIESTEAEFDDVQPAVEDKPGTGAVDRLH